MPYEKSEKSRGLPQSSFKNIEERTSLKKNVKEGWEAKIKLLITIHKSCLFNVYIWKVLRIVPCTKY